MSSCKRVAIQKGASYSRLYSISLCCKDENRQILIIERKTKVVWLRIILLVFMLLSVIKFLIYKYSWRSPFWQNSVYRDDFQKINQMVHKTLTPLYHSFYRPLHLRFSVTISLFERQIRRIDQNFPFIK